MSGCGEQELWQLVRQLPTGQQPAQRCPDQRPVEAQTLLATARPKFFKRLAGGNEKACLGLRAALLHHMAVQANQLILMNGQEFLLVAAFVFALIRMIASAERAPNLTFTLIV